MKNKTEILDILIPYLYPIILLYGFYVILYGHSSPGGGFQGGAILSSVFISQYFVDPNPMIEIHLLEKVEKIFLILIILFPLFFIFNQAAKNLPYLQIPYLILMNLLIGIKVSCGLTIIFFRFIYHEGGS